MSSATWSQNYTQVEIIIILKTNSVIGTADAKKCSMNDVTGAILKTVEILFNKQTKASLDEQNTAPGL